MYGISPELIDDDESMIEENGESLLEKLIRIDGVIRIDPHQRTVDLEKWHIAVEYLKKDAICEKLDQILGEIDDVTLENVKVHQKFTNFPLSVKMNIRNNTSISSSSS